MSTYGTGNIQGEGGKTSLYQLVRTSSQYVTFLEKVNILQERTNLIRQQSEQQQTQDQRRREENDRDSAKRVVDKRLDIKFQSDALFEKRIAEKDEA